MPSVKMFNLGGGGGGGSVATDAIFDAKGDLPVGTGADTAARLAVGADKTMLMALAAEATGAKWEKPTRVIASTETTLPVADTTVETNLFSLTLPGGLVAAGDRILVSMIGDQLNNSLATVTYTYRFKIGATTVLATSAQSFTTNANRRRWTCTVEIAVASATAQRVGALLSVSNVAADTWATVSGAAPFNPYVGSNTSAEDTGTDKAIVLSVQMGTAHADADCRLLAAALTHVRKL